MIEVYVKGGLLKENFENRRDVLSNWCNENCVDYFLVDLLSSKIRFSFSNEDDAMAFKLRWL